MDGATTTRTEATTMTTIWLDLLLVVSWGTFLGLLPVWYSEKYLQP
jgi:hypothetical protein